MAGNYARGAIVSAVILGGVAALVVLALGLRPRPLAVGLALLGGAIAGFLLGGFINAARKLPVNVDALDTFTMDERPGDPVRVEVRVEGALADEAEAVFRKHDALDVQQSRG